MPLEINNFGEGPQLTMCPQCPWLRSNHGKKTKYGFYTKRNLNRLWNEIRGGGGGQSCHLTDSRHPDHIAAGAPTGAQMHECPGAIALVYRETLKIQLIAGLDVPIEKEHIDAYLRDNPKGLKFTGILYWVVTRMALGGTPMGNERMPAIDPLMVADVTNVGRQGEKGDA